MSDRVAGSRPHVVADEGTLARLCSECTPTAACATLVTALNHALDPLRFQLRLSRDGWYRSGGILSASGERISSNLREWVEAQGEVEPQALLERYADRGWRVTRLIGTTHYLTAVDATAPAGFIQLEIEQLYEVVERPLVVEDWYPDDMEEFIDPPDLPRDVLAEAGEPYYRFRRVTPLDACMEYEQGEQRQPTQLKRMLDEWRQSSAVQAAAFCEQWVVTVAPFLDRYGEQRYSVKLLPTQEGVPALDDSVIETGAKLASLIHTFDRRVGYPMAWYFFMLARHKVSTRIAEAIHLDMMGAYDYLPLGDLKLLRGWSDAPYTV